MENIQTNYGDLGNENAQRLLATILSTPPKSAFVDLGVRLGVSSRLMLTEADARGNEVYGVEAIGCAPCLEDILKKPNYHFISGDSVTTGLTWAGPKLHLLMCDTFHFAEHLLCELYAWWPHIAPGGYCVVHDTAWGDDHFDFYAGMKLPHVIDGVREFFDEHLSTYTSYPESFGMTFARKHENEDLVSYISPERWREVFAVRRAVMNAVNLPIAWKDLFNE